MSSTYAPRSHLWRPHVDVRRAALAGLALVVAATAGYAIAGGFTSESAPGQEVSDRVMEAWASGDAASIAAAYDPAVKVVLVYAGTEEVVASNIGELTDAINGAKSFGNTYEPIGPVSHYEGEDGDVYVTGLVEVKGPGHPSGDPLVGFYRVRDGKVIRHVFMDAEHY